MPNGQVSENEGVVELNLDVRGVGRFDSFAYTITGPEAFRTSGVIDTRRSPLPAAIIGGIPQGAGYTVVLVGKENDGGPGICTGAAEFEVRAHATTELAIEFTCTGPPTRGSIDISGSINLCPEVRSIVVVPSPQYVGSTIDLSAAVSDSDDGPKPLAISWSASQGTLTDADSARATYSCTTAGNANITLRVSDGDPSPNCDSVAAFAVTCWCRTSADCQVADDCATAVCSGGSCQYSFKPKGTPVAQQTPGDCHRNECDGSGSVIAVVDDSDAPLDDDPCTTDRCANGTPAHPASPVETPCGGDKLCNGGSGASACELLKFWVVRDGSGDWPLTADAYPVFLDQYSIDGAKLGTIALPTQSEAGTPPNQPFTHALTLSGVEGSDGELSRSVDGRYLSMAGYAAEPETPGVVSSTSSSIKRVVARIDAAGNVDTTTVLLTAFSGSDVRGAVSVDGSAFWVGGDSNWRPTKTGNDTGGIWYIPFRATGGTQLVAPTDAGVLPNIRWLGIHGEQPRLFGDSDQGPGLYLFEVGSGLPTVGGQILTSLPGLPTSQSMSPYGFAFLDRNPFVTGLDTLYIADDGSGAYGHGGIQKWTYDGAVWTHVTTFHRVGGSVFFFRGLIAHPGVHDTVILVATSATSATSNAVVVFVDDGSSDRLGDAGALSAVEGRIVATAPGTTSQSALPYDTVFRGIALAPHD